MQVNVTEAEQLATSEGIYRAAFPAYRVFIYGYEVTDDVSEVRVNQSGGSAERMAGSCSITLLNKFDKYIITHSDMQVIGRSRSAFKNEYESKIKQSVQDGLYMFECVEVIEDALKEDEKKMIETLMSQGYSEDESTKAVSKLHEIKDKSKGDLSLAWSDELVPGWFKKEILGKKMTYSQQATPVQDTNLVRWDAETIFDYPMQEGDCIFHPNDPIRIAFRDPYDPRVWYWMFSGFMDTFTENVGTNKESILTISGTDVSKMARYALVHINTGILDVNIADSLREVANVATTNISLYQQFFGGLTLFEILETIFYGSASLKSFVKESTQALVANMSQEELWNYVSANIKVDDSVFVTGSPTQGVEQSYYENAESYRPKVMEHMVSRKLDTLTGQLQGRDVGAVSSPRGIKFRRKNSKTGVTAYFLGVPDEADLAIGEALNDLGKWNEVIHHRVRESDLENMSVDGNRYMSSDLTYASGMTPENVIYTIGTDLEHYPVGCGRVFYFSPATLGSNLGRDVMDKSLTQSISFHSVFRDRLSLIYDMAERLEFRFYATPRGDLVFEMPFYDFNPEYFATGSSAIDPGFDRALVSQNYSAIFSGAYDGKYGSDVQQLTQMSIQIESEGAHFSALDFTKAPVFDYGREFTIEEYEQTGYSNTSTDEGVLTVYLCNQRTVKSMDALNNQNLYGSQVASVRGLIPTLGVRVGSGDPWGYVDTSEGAEAYAAITLNRVNAEARNLSVSTTPKFGLMVNRPLFWRPRNYYANIVSLSQSVVWLGDCSTTVNLNQIRGWGGDIDENGNPLHLHMGGKRAFNLAEFLQQYLVKGKKTQGD